MYCVNLNIHIVSASCRKWHLESKTNLFDTKLHFSSCSPYIYITWTKVPSFQKGRLQKKQTFMIFRKFQQSNSAMISSRICRIYWVLKNKCPSSIFFISECCLTKCYTFLNKTETNHPLIHQPPAWCELTGCQCRIEGDHIGFQALLLFGTPGTKVNEQHNIKKHVKHGDFYFSRETNIHNSTEKKERWNCISSILQRERIW